MQYYLILLYLLFWSVNLKQSVLSWFYYYYVAKILLVLPKWFIRKVCIWITAFMLFYVYFSNIAPVKLSPLIYFHSCLVSLFLALKAIAKRFLLLFAIAFKRLKEHFDRVPKIISHFGGTNNTFIDYIILILLLLCKYKDSLLKSNNPLYKKPIPLL